MFDALDTAHGSIVAMTHFLRGVRLNLSRIADHGPHGYLNATELADYLVSKGIAFRSAHEIAGKIVRRALEMELPLESLPLAEMQQFASCIDNSVFESLKISEALTKKSAMGGTSPSRVKQAVMDSRTYVTAHRVE